MAKVIIEVKSLRDNGLTGKTIPSETGGDKDHLYMVIDYLSGDYVILNNGSTKAVQMSKKKNLKHIDVLEDVDDGIKASIISKDRGTDLKIKKFLEFKGTIKKGWLSYVEE